MERLFSSKALHRTLALFFRYPEESLNPRLISYRTCVDIKAVLRAQEAGRYRMFRLNREHPAYSGLLSIFGGPEQETGPGVPDPVDRLLEELLRTPHPFRAPHQ